MSKAIHILSYFPLIASVFHMRERRTYLWKPRWSSDNCSKKQVIRIFLLMVSGPDHEAHWHRRAWEASWRSGRRIHHRPMREDKAEASSHLRSESDPSKDSCQCAYADKMNILRAPTVFLDCGTVHTDWLILSKSRICAPRNSLNRALEESALSLPSSYGFNPQLLDRHPSLDDPHKFCKYSILNILSQGRAGLLPRVRRYNSLINPALAIGHKSAATWERGHLDTQQRENWNNNFDFLCLAIVQ